MGDVPCRQAYLYFSSTSAARTSPALLDGKGACVIAQALCSLRQRPLRLRLAALALVAEGVTLRLLHPLSHDAGH